MAINQENIKERVLEIPTENLKAGTEYSLWVGANKYKNVIVNDNLETVIEAGTEFIEKDTISDFRAISEREIWAIQSGYYKGVKLNGYYQKGDTPTPIDYYISSTSDQDDGGSVIVISSSKFEHQFQNEVNVRYFGAKVDNVTDDRVSFIKAADYVSRKGGYVYIDGFMRIVIGQDPSKTIIFKDNVHVTGLGIGSITLDNKYTPAFVFGLSKNCSFKDIDIYFNAKYDMSIYGFVEGSTTTTIGRKFDTDFYKPWLTINKGITFTGSYNPIPLVHSAYMGTFVLKGTDNTTFQNMKMLTKGINPNEFIPWCFKLEEERPSNTQIDNSTADLSTLCTNTSFLNLYMDGTIMGIQGGGENIIIDNLRSLRYSDLQNDDGSFIGGYNYNGQGLYWTAPPHLIYLNDKIKNLTINNVIDYGVKVGVTKVRPTASGYCNSIKVKGENLDVSNVHSYRPDGLGDFMNGSKNMSLKTLKSVYDSSIFKEGLIYPSIRFPSDEDGVENPFNGLYISDVEIIDIAPVSRIFPMTLITRGSQVIAKGIDITMNDFSGTYCGFNANGDNNDIEYNVTLLNHTQTSNNVLQLNVNSINANVPIGRQNGKNNRYNIKYKGWRLNNTTNDFNNKKGRITLASIDNPNNNEAIVEDITNGLRTIQNGTRKKEIWTRTLLVDAPSTGNTLNTSINVPAGWKISEISLGIITSFGTSGGLTSLALGTTTGNSGTSGDEYLTSSIITSGNNSTTYKDTSATDVINSADRPIHYSP